MEKSYQHYDCIIIGAGISGLYTAYRLHEKKLFNFILIIDKSDCEYGKINSVGDQAYELGAGRFCPERHKRLSQLLKTVDIETVPFDYPVLSKNKKQIKEGLAKVYEHVTNNAAQKSFLTVLSGLLGSKKAYSFCQNLGYDSFMSDKLNFSTGKKFLTTLPEIVQLNPLKLQQPWMKPKSGFSELARKLKQSMKANVSIHRNVVCKKISKHRDTFQIELTGASKNHHLTSSHVIFAIPPHELNDLRFEGELHKPYIEHTVYPLFKCYIEYDTPWFESIIQSKTGVFLNANNFRKLYFDVHQYCLFFYTDGPSALKWQAIFQNQKADDIIKSIKKQLAYFLDIKPDSIPSPKNIYPKFWPHGVCHPHRPIAPTLSQGLYFVSEGYSDFQGWIEGCLQSADRIINTIETKDGETSCQQL